MTSFLGSEIDKIFEELKSKNSERHLTAAQELRRYLCTTVPGLSPDAVKKLWDEHINRQLFELTHSQHSHEALGGLVAISALLDIDLAEIDSKRNLFRFWNYVKHLQSNHDVGTLLSASSALGQIVKVGGDSFGESFMDKEVSSAIQMMNQATTRHAGVLILKELACNLPGPFYSYSSIVLEQILVPLHDSSHLVRQSASELLGACLKALIHRERDAVNPYLPNLLRFAQTGFKQSSTDVTHGSLLIYRELLLHAGMAIHESFIKMAEQIFDLKSHRELLVRKAVIALIPLLAAYDTLKFKQRFLQKAMVHLLAAVDKPLERDSAFLSIGNTATAVGGDMKPFLEDIMGHIEQRLQARGSSAGESLFDCITMLAAAMGPNLTKMFHGIIDLMLIRGLSQPLRQALVAISSHIPPLLSVIQDRLLNLIAGILSGTNYTALGTPAFIGSNTPNAPDMLAEKTPELIYLSLQTLGSFDFGGHVLNEFVRTNAVPYLDDDHAETRRAAVVACCRLLVRDPVSFQTSVHATEVFSDVINKLVIVSVADPDSSVRHTTLSSLHESFDKHLAQAENIRSIFIVLNDENFENRAAAVKLIGRLALHNPAYVLPPLRKMLIQLLTELEYSPDRHSQQECSRILALLTQATRRLIKPYALPMLRVLLQKAVDADPTVAANILMCIGALTSVSGEEASPFVPEITQVIIPCLVDTSAKSLEKRDAALHLLGEVCSSTGYVIEPLLDHPELLEILDTILKIERRKPIRREVLKVLGILGAMDPYHRKRRSEVHVNERTAINVFPLKESEELAPSKDHIQSTVFSSLLAVLNDQTLGAQHAPVIEAIMTIFKTQGLRCVSFLPQIIPAFSTATRNSPSRLDFYLEQLAILISIVKHNIRTLVPDILDVIKDLWERSTVHRPIVVLIETMSKVLDAEFKPFLPMILPLLLGPFSREISETENESRMDTQIEIFNAFLSFGTNLDEYLQLVLPVIVASYERVDGPTPLRKKAIQTIEGLSNHINFSDHASHIILPLVRVLESSSSDLQDSAMNSLCALAFQLGSDFFIFMPTVNKAMQRNVINHSRYKRLIHNLLHGLPLQESVFDITQKDSGIVLSGFSEPAEAAALVVNQQHLKQAWNISQITTREDWTKWLQHLVVEFIKESPSHSLRACMTLAENHPFFGRTLFNVSFLSCWVELYEQYQDDFIKSINIAMTSTAAPPELLHVFLDLAEFMEHEEKPLPFEHKTLSGYAIKVGAFATALHYEELEFLSLPPEAPIDIEPLFSLNARLQQHDAAHALLDADQGPDVTNHGEHYGHLGLWQEALDAYIRKADSQPNNSEVELGMIKCLHALGDWDHLAAQVKQIWPNASRGNQQEIAPMAAAAAWFLHQWGEMEGYIASMQSDSLDRAFYRAILAVHRNQFDMALTQIAKARDLLELDSIIGEGYGRSYDILVRSQMLSELEEAILYKQCQDQPERQRVIEKTWMTRIQGCQPTVGVWQRILQIRTSVLNPQHNPEAWIKFANLCRKSEHMLLAEKIIDSLILPHQLQEMHMTASPRIVYAKLKFMWASGSKAATIEFLRRFSTDLEHYLQVTAVNGDISSQVLADTSNLLARCYFKLGRWQLESGNLAGENVDNILRSFHLATHFDPSSHKAWHAWAMVNFQAIGYLESQTQPHTTNGSDTVIVAHAIQAIQGFFRSISLRNEEPLQDTLRILTLWFKFGSVDGVSDAMSIGVSTVEVVIWLAVIPQIIARIQSSAPNLQRTINQLLDAIGRNHPQSLIYPLTVASKSSNAGRSNAALSMMARLRTHSPALVSQGLLIVQELVRVAALWHELWRDGLEEASRCYFNRKDPDEMIAVLDPLHEMVEGVPTTTREVFFVQKCGRELREARKSTHRWRTHGDIQDIDNAWSIYQSIYKKIDEIQKQLKVLDLQYVSPTLMTARNLELAVPGTYRIGLPVIPITKFDMKLPVIASKQHPRRLTIKGGDGRDYLYLLKGGEDLRQDERVMQLFDLANNLLSAKTESFKRRLHIQGYPVIPLDTMVGLISWAQGTDTLHALITGYRESRRILPNIEHRLRLQMAPDYELLTQLQKTEVYELTLQTTTGLDLYKLLWLKSTSSDHWLERRTTYTRSTAVNSMIGYILGLGDRHPANLLMERSTGKIVHIDFGDCFEVAMDRDNFAERVPFRLTRMLTRAMEVRGIEGSFRKSCEVTMRVLRDNKDSLMAVLETFVNDPLITWRLMKPKRVDDTHSSNTEVHIEGPTRKPKTNENEIFGDQEVQEDLNERALAVYNRVQYKLTGRDFNPDSILSVENQVKKLIEQATASENLCEAFTGWCPFW